MSKIVIIEHWLKYDRFTAVNDGYDGQLARLGNYEMKKSVKLTSILGDFLSQLYISLFTQLCYFTRLEEFLVKSVVHFVCTFNSKIMLSHTSAIVDVSLCPEIKR